MKRRLVPSLVAIFCVSITVAGFSQSKNATKTISRAVGAQTSGTLSDGTGGVFISLSMPETPTKPGIPCAGNPSAPNCLTAQAFDTLTGAFGQTEQVLQPGEFAFNTPDTLNSAHVRTTLVTPDPVFSGVTFDLTWTANSPIIKSTTEQHCGSPSSPSGCILPLTGMPGLHAHSTGSSRFATVSGTSSLTGILLDGTLATCCTWNGDGQILNNLTQTINIIKP